MVQALVPLKELADAKSRLADLLEPDERIALVAAMASDVLNVLAAHPALRRVVLVTDDPAATELVAGGTVECWSERELGTRGLNELVGEASRRLLAECADPLLVLHADLPLLSAADIDAVLQAREAEAGLVICSDRAGTGTNLLGFDRSCVPRFCFGVDSCAAHLRAAREAGVPARIVRRLGTSLDVDTPGDVAALIRALRHAGAGKTRTVLLEGGLMERLEQALSPAVVADQVLLGERVE